MRYNGSIKLITILLYAIFDIGLIMLFWEAFKSRYYARQLKSKVKEENGEIEGGKFIKNLNKTLHIALDTDDEGIAFSFITFSAVLGALLFVVLTALFNPGLGLFGGAAGAVLPYMIVRVKLQNFQVEISKEGEALISALLSNYLTNSQNIREAIARTALDLDGAPRSRRAMMNLARSLTSASSRYESEMALEEFRFSFDTAWGDILTTNIRFAYNDGIVITNALRDLSSGITSAMRAYEANKRENSESKILLKFYFPIICILVYVGAVGLFNFTPEKFFKYQFQTPLGVMWTIILCVSYMLSVLVTNKLTKIKMDL